MGWVVYWGSICRRSSFVGRGTRLEDGFHDRYGGEGVGPADVEGEMRDDFPGLGLRKAVIHGPVEVVGHLRDLACGDQCADGDEAPVSWRKARPQPEISEKHVGCVLHEPRHHGARLLLDTSGALGLGAL